MIQFGHNLLLTTVEIIAYLWPPIQNDAQYLQTEMSIWVHPTK